MNRKNISKMMLLILTTSLLLTGCGKKKNEDEYVYGDIKIDPKQFTEGGDIDAPMFDKEGYLVEDLGTYNKEEAESRGYTKKVKTFVIEKDDLDEATTVEKDLYIDDLPHQKMLEFAVRRSMDESFENKQKGLLLYGSEHVLIVDFKDDSYISSVATEYSPKSPNEDKYVVSEDGTKEPLIGDVMVDETAAFTAIEPIVKTIKAFDKEIGLERTIMLNINGSPYQIKGITDSSGLVVH